MAGRLLVGVLGNRNSGKSHTWNVLFGGTVRRGTHARRLILRPGECVEVFLVSGSPEERDEYAGDILAKQDCRIVLCSLQYSEDVHRSIDYFRQDGFFLYIQWLNPGYNDHPVPAFDALGLINKILSSRSVFSVRDGQADAERRVREIRQFIYGWARYRDLIRRAE